MNIRTRLTLMFFGIVIFILTGISVSIYFFSANYRSEDFLRRLKNRAINVVNILLEVKEVDTELLKRLDQNNPANLPNQYIIIYDTSGMVYKSDIVQPITIDSALLETVKKHGLVTRTEHMFEIIGFRIDEDNMSYIVIAAASDVFGRDALTNLRNILLIVFLISLVLVSGVGWMYAGRVLSPISRIVSEVSTITEVNLAQRLDEGNKTDELGKLARAFNDLLKRLQRVFNSQRFFIANASHEIKTPITAMTGVIEVALMQQRSPEYYLKILRTTLSNLKRLDRLSSQLLLLAQTSSQASEKNFSILRIDDIFWDVKSQLQKAHGEYKIDVLFDLNVDAQAFQLEGDEQLLRIAIQNLMENGCKYSPEHHVAIHLHSRDNGFMTASFENAGTVDPEHRDKIFEPFFRGRSARNQEGFGIGLSLVYWIVRLHGGTIAVHTNSGNVVFTLQLPLKH